MQVTVHAPEAPAPSAAPHTVQRTCYNIRDPPDRDAHLQRLFLQPRSTDKDRPVPGYSAATPLRNGGLAVPRFYGQAAFGTAREDRTVPGARASFPFVGTLLPYQDEVIDAVVGSVQRTGGALLCAGCGCGKVG